MIAFNYGKCVHLKNKFLSSDSFLKLGLSFPVSFSLFVTILTVIYVDNCQLIVRYGIRTQTVRIRCPHFTTCAAKNSSVRFYAMLE